jgi:hypothetical protein
VDWEKAKQIHNARIASRVKPFVVVEVYNSAEIVRAVLCAVMNNITVKAVSGRHTYEPYCENGCILIDVRQLKRVSINAAASTAVLGSGLNLGQVYVHLDDHGFTLPGGTCATVGLGGITLGGGLGVLARSYGLLADRLFALDLILPNGTEVRADAGHHSDLLWLARGSGGDQFPGIVTAYHFHLVPKPSMVTAFSMTYNLSQAERVAHHYQTHLLVHSDRRLYAEMEFNTCGSGEKNSGPCVRLDCMMLNVTAEYAKKVMEPTRLALGPPLEETFVEEPFLRYLTKDLNGNATREQFLKPARPFCCGPDAEFTESVKQRALVIETPIPVEGLRNLIDFVFGAPFGGGNGSFYMQFDPSNGAVGDLAPDATPYRWRGSKYMTLQTVQRWTGNPSNLTLEMYSQGLIAALQPYVGVRSYVNYLDKSAPGGMAPCEQYWGENAKRILRLRSQYTNKSLAPSWELQPRRGVQYQIQRLSEQAQIATAQWDQMTDGETR